MTGVFCLCVCVFVSTCVFIACEKYKPNKKNNNKMNMKFVELSYTSKKILFMMLTLKYFYPLLSSRVPRQPQPYTMYVLLATELILSNVHTFKQQQQQHTTHQQQ